MNPARRRFLIGAAATAAAIAVPAAGRSTAARSGARPQPTDALVTRWDTDPYAMGAYSALPAGTSPSVRRTLANAVLGGSIVFAGEYASSRRPSTTSGAYESGVFAANRVLNRIEPARVIVIGAGMAGAAAANALSAEGVDVTVVEARDRIGGRIHSDSSWGVPVELGAAWIHGLSSNPVTTLAKAVGLPLARTDYDDSIVHDTATGRTSAQAERAQAQMVRLVSQLENAWPRATMSTQEWLKLHGWVPDRFTTWAAEVEITQEYGLAPSVLGVRAPEEGVTLRGGDAFVGGGYQRIPEALLDGIEVKRRTPVTSVTGSNSGVSVACQDGTVLRADAAILAVPLAILRAKRILVQPMTWAVTNALGKMRTGDLEKVVLRYDEQWWPDVQLLEAVGGGVPGAPAGSLAALRWTEFYSVTDLLGFPALVGFSGGAASMARPSSNDACIDEAVNVLGAAFPQ